MNYSNWHIIFILFALFPLLHCLLLEKNDIQKPIHTVKHHLYIRRADEARCTLQEQIQELKTRIKNVVRDMLRLEEIVVAMDRDMDIMIYAPESQRFHEVWQKRNQVLADYWERDFELQELNAKLAYVNEHSSVET